MQRALAVGEVLHNGWNIAPSIVKSGRCNTIYHLPSRVVTFPTRKYRTIFVMEAALALCRYVLRRFYSRALSWVMPCLHGASRMENRGALHAVNAGAARRLLPMLCMGLLVTGVGFTSVVPARPALEALDPMFMKAVTASVSQHDVKAILAHQRSSAPVHLRLFTSCHEENRCTILTTMDFPHSDLHAPAITLRVVTRVIPGTGNSDATIASSWQVQSVHSAIHETTAYAGDFSQLNDVPALGDQSAIAGLLTSIRSAIGNVLDANGVVAQRHTVEI